MELGPGVGLTLGSGDEESLIGWKGESFKPGDVFGSKVGTHYTLPALSRHASSLTQ